MHYSMVFVFTGQAIGECLELLYRISRSPLVTMDAVT